MPIWSEILAELQTSSFDDVRRKYLSTFTNIPDAMSSYTLPAGYKKVMCRLVLRPSMTRMYRHSWRSAMN